MNNYISSVIKTLPKAIASKYSNIVICTNTNSLVAVKCSEKKIDTSNYSIIQSVRQLKALAPFAFVNLSIDATHNSSFNIFEDYVDKNMPANDASFYKAAFIHLYPTYKSLGVLVEADFFNFIVTFIDNCAKKSDYPNTICYNAYEIHEILKLRKVIFNKFKDYLNDYGFYTRILACQNDKKFTDKEFTKVKTALKKKGCRSWKDLKNYAEAKKNEQSNEDEPGDANTRLDSTPRHKSHVVSIGAGENAPEKSAA